MGVGATGQPEKSITNPDCHYDDYQDFDELGDGWVDRELPESPEKDPDDDQGDDDFDER
jgi:hypothetical protein